MLGRYNDLTFEYLDALSITKGYDFLFCTLCQKVRSTPFAIYRVTPKTPTETFIAIGMSIALEKQFQHEIPKILLTASVQDVPSLLSGCEVVEAQNDTERKARLQKFMPVVVQKARKTILKSRPLPFIEVVPRRVERPHYSGKVETEIIPVDEVVEISDETIVKPEVIPVDESLETNKELILDTAVATRHSQTAQMEAQERARCAQVAQQATGRQLDVLRAFAQGLSPQEVASQLGLSIKTVDTHKTVLLGLCRAAWNIEAGMPLDYRFLYKNFAAYFNNDEMSSLDPVSMGELQAVPSASVTLELPRSGNKKQELGDMLAGTEKYVARSSARTVKVFVLGPPGSGKSTAARYISMLVRDRGWSAIHISDYAILYNMFQADVECKQFRPKVEHDGFDVLDLSVFDIALRELEKKVQELDSTRDGLVTIEFARADYSEALRQFNPRFLEDAYFLFVDTDIDTCIQRIRERVAQPATPDDHFVSEYIFETYYHKDDRQYMSSNLKTDYSIDDYRIKVIDNTGSLHNFIEGVTQFTEQVLTLSAVEDADGSG